MAGTFAIQLVSFVAHLKYWGPIQAPPEPTTGNKIYFTRAPAAIFLGLDGYPGPLPQSCLQYMVATLPPNKISVMTMHKVPEFFNNDLVTPASVMKDYPIRYQSLAGELLHPQYQAVQLGLWTNTDNSVYTSDGEWVTVYLPSEPRLTPAQIAQVRAVAQALELQRHPASAETRPGP